MSAVSLALSLIMDNLYMYVDYQNGNKIVNYNMIFKWYLKTDYTLLEHTTRDPYCVMTIGQY